MDSGLTQPVVRLAICVESRVCLGLFCVQVLCSCPSSGILFLTLQLVSACSNCFQLRVRSAINQWLEPRPGSSDVSPPCLEAQDCRLIPSSCLLPCYSAWSCCSFCLFFVSAFGPVSCLLSRNFIQLCSPSRDRLFCIVFFSLFFFFLFSGCEMISWSMVSVACYLTALV